MDRETLERYLGDASRRGAPLPEGFDGAAGGAPCGDLVRVSVALAGGRITRVSFDAEGCAAANAAAAAVAELADGATVLDAARIGPDRVADALGGVGAQGRHAVELAADALHRALSGATGSGLELAPPPAAGERVLVALSGGVDSAVAAVRERERGADVVAVTLKLWADRRTDAARSCCSPLAVLGARALALELGIPHLTLDLERDFRRRVVGAFVDGYRHGRTPNPCVICNGEVRIDAMLALAERLGCAALATGHYARIVDDGAGPLLAAAADPAKDQTYMLSGLRPRSLARLRFPLAELTKAEVREHAASAPGWRWRGRPRARTSAFSPARASARSSPATAASPSGPVRSSTAPGDGWASIAATTSSRSGSGAGCGSAGPSLATCSRSTPGRTPSWSDRATSSPPTGSRSAHATLHRPGGVVDRVLLRYHSRPLACEAPPVAAGEHAALELALAEPAYGVAPGQTACLLAGDVVVGRATIA